MLDNGPMLWPGAEDVRFNQVFVLLRPTRVALAFGAGKHNSRAQSQRLGRFAAPRPGLQRGSLLSRQPHFNRFRTAHRTILPHLSRTAIQFMTQDTSPIFPDRDGLLRARLDAERVSAP